MSEEIEQEIAAIKSVLDALTPLKPDVRQNVLDYVVKRLQMAQAGKDENAQTYRAAAMESGSPGAPASTVIAPTGPIRIKNFKEQKNPRSAAEMSAIVAYYLANLAPTADRRDRITTREIETFFKIANFPLPRKIEMTLVNAKASGYLDSMGNGEYKLNAVGHNLVAHNLPRGTESKPASRRTPAKRTRRSAKKPND